MQLEVSGVVGKIHWRPFHDHDYSKTSSIQVKISREKRLLLAMMNSQLSVIWIPILVTLVHGQGINLNPDEGSPCFVRDKDGIDDLSQPQVS